MNRVGTYSPANSRRSPRTVKPSLFLPGLLPGILLPGILLLSVLPAAGKAAGVMAEGLHPAGRAAASASRSHSAPLSAWNFESVRSVRNALAALKAAHPEKESAAEQNGKEEEDGIELLEGWLFYLQQRAYPNDTVDWGAYLRAAARREADPPARAANAGDRWNFVGPTGLPVPYRQYFGQGAINGRANTVAFDPAHRGAYYLGSAGGGLWRTTDRGKNWTPLTDQWPFLQVSSIAIAPGGTTLYVGTGDFSYPAPGYSQGLLRSIDAGNTWQPIGPAELQHFAISKVLLDPDDPSVITVSAGRGRDRWGYVWRSTDAGRHWKAVLQRPAAWCDVECGARGKSGVRRYYAVGYDAAGMRLIMRSMDRGATWTQVYSAGPVIRPSLAALAVSPTDPLRAYVILGGIQQVLDTPDGGATWSNVTGNLPADYNWSQDWYDLWLNASTRKDSAGKSHDVLYAGLIDVSQSLKPGTWRSIGLSYTPESLTHNDQQGSAVDPSDPYHLLVASDGGAYELHYRPAADTWTWTSLNEHLGITQFYKSAFHPTNPDELLAGTQDNSTPAHMAGSKNWINVGGGDGAFCGINPKHPNIQYASSQFLWLYHTRDSWATSEDFAPSFGSDLRAFIAPFTLDPTRPNLLYAGTNYLWRWNEENGEWAARLGGQKLSAAGVVMFIAVAPGDSRRIYTGSNRGELWMTTDGGATWLPINTGAPSLPDRAITSIVVDPHDPGSILVGVSGTGTGHLWRCADTTASERTWTDLSGSGGAALPDIPLDSIAVIPPGDGSSEIAGPTASHAGQVIYAGTDVGVFRTEDGGQTWSNATGPLGLPNVPVNDLQYVPGTGYLNAATFGRGLWRLKIGGDKQTTAASLRTSGSTEDRTRNRLPDLAGLLLVITGSAGVYFLVTRKLNARRPVV